MQPNRRKLNPIEVLALQIAASTPMRPSGSCIDGYWTGTAYVRWDFIMRLRAALDEAGVDWRRIHKLIKEEEATHRKKIADRYRREEVPNGS